MISHEQKARELARVLACIAKEPMTARKIAAKCDTTKPTAYNRLECLRSLGYMIDEVKVRDGKSGPEAKAYKLRTVPPPAKQVPARMVTTIARVLSRKRRKNAAARAK